MHKLCDLSLGFTDFINKKNLEPYPVQNAKILNLSNYQNFTKKVTLRFVVMLLIVIQELLQYCETLKAS